MMSTQSERLKCIQTAPLPPRIKSALNRSGGSFAESLILPPPYPRQELRSNTSFVLKANNSNDCDSLSSGSGSGSDHDDDDEDSPHEPSAFSGSFAESVSPPRRRMYPQSCFIPSLLPSKTPEVASTILGDAISPPPPQPFQSSLVSSSSSSLPSSSSNCRRQLFVHESNSNSINQELQRVNNVTAVQHPPSPPPISSSNNNTSPPTINTSDGIYVDDNGNDNSFIQEHNTLRGDEKDQQPFSTVEWLQTTTECYGNAHVHTLLPVVLEEDEVGGASSSPDKCKHKQKRIDCESKPPESESKQPESELNTESESKIDVKSDTISTPIPSSTPILTQKPKTNKFCSSTNEESLHTILSIHNSYHNDDHHHPLKINTPATDTIGSDTYQTQSLSNNSSFSSTIFSKDDEINPSNPSTPTNNTSHNHQIDNNNNHRHTHHLEEELDSRLQVIMALKDVVLDQNRASKKVTRENRKITSKLAMTAKANRKLNRRNRTLEEQVEALQKELGEMRDRVVEVENDLGEERRWQLRRELELKLGGGGGGDEEEDNVLFGSIDNLFQEEKEKDIFNDCFDNIYEGTDDQASF